MADTPTNHNDLDLLLEGLTVDTPIGVEQAVIDSALEVPPLTQDELESILEGQVESGALSDLDSIVIGALLKSEAAVCEEAAAVVGEARARLLYPEAFGNGDMHAVTKHWSGSTARLLLRGITDGRKTVSGFGTFESMARTFWAWHNEFGAHLENGPTGYEDNEHRVSLKSLGLDREIVETYVALRWGKANDGITVTRLGLTFETTEIVTRLPFLPKDSTWTDPDVPGSSYLMRIPNTMFPQTMKDLAAES